MNKIFNLKRGAKDQNILARMVSVIVVISILFQPVSVVFAEASLLSTTTEVQNINTAEIASSTGSEQISIPSSASSGQESIAVVSSASDLVETNNQTLQMASSATVSPASSSYKISLDSKTYYKGDIVKLSWTNSDKEALVSVWYKNIGSGISNQITFHSSLAGENFYDWTIPNEMALGQYSILIKYEDTLLAESSNAITIADKIISAASVSPIISLVTPSSAEVGSLITLTGSNFGTSTPNRVFFKSTDPSVTGSNTIGNLYSSDGFSLSFEIP
ncbi:MAG: hypothetical protein WCT19_01320, partial [Candidatus Paceibacterota bacterium]